MISKGKLEKITGWGKQVSEQVANLENKSMSIDDKNQQKDLGTGSYRNWYLLNKDILIFLFTIIYYIFGNML